MNKYVLLGNYSIKGKKNKKSIYINPGELLGLKEVDIHKHPMLYTKQKNEFIAIDIKTIDIDNAFIDIWNRLVEHNNHYNEVFTLYNECIKWRDFYIAFFQNSSGKNNIYQSRLENYLKIEELGEFYGSRKSPYLNYPKLTVKEALTKTTDVFSELYNDNIYSEYSKMISRSNVIEELLKMIDCILHIITLDIYDELKKIEALDIS